MALIYAGQPQRADLRGADLTAAELMGANLDGVKADGPLFPVV